MIRRAEEGDLEACWRLVCALEERELPEKEFAEIYRDVRKDPDHLVLLEEEGGQVRGMIHARIEAQLHHAGKTAEILELVVEEGSRKKGIGARLFRAVREWAKESGCLQLEVSSHARRKGAHAFYERMGLKKDHVTLTGIL